MHADISHRHLDIVNEYEPKIRTVFTGTVLQTQCIGTRAKSQKMKDEKHKRWQYGMPPNHCLAKPDASLHICFFTSTRVHVHSPP
jgi:hypothetical protein